MLGPLRDDVMAGFDALSGSGLVERAGVIEVWRCFERLPGSGWSRAWLLWSLGWWLARLRQQTPTELPAVDAALPPPTRGHQYR
jgi:hypothetical protein